MWSCIKAGLVRSGRFFSQRLQGFFAATLVCFFYGVPTKRGSVGAYSCFTNQPPWITVRCVGAWIYRDDFSKTDWKSHWKCYCFTNFSFLRSSVTTDAPSAYTTLPPGWPSHRKDPLPGSWTFPRISASRLFKYVWSIQRQNVRNNSLNGRA